MPTPPRFTISCICGGWLIGVEGRGTFLHSPGFQALAEGCLSGPRDVVLIDLTTCDYLDSSFLGSLVGLHRRFAAGAEPRLRIVASQATRQRLFGSTALEPLFRYAEDCPEPLGAPQEIELRTVDRRQLGRHMLEAHRQLAELGGPAAEQFREIAQRLTAELAQEDPP